MNRTRAFVLTTLTGLAVHCATGCEPRDVEVDEAFQSDPRYNRAPAPATGLKQNPARPTTERPPPGPDR